MKIKALKGTSDILPQEVHKWQYIEDLAREVFRLYNYNEIRTPIIEETPLFIRTIGGTTDIVQKQMYTFRDKANRSISLRPEETAPVVRAYLEHNLDKEPGLTKLYYIGPMFRSERPQAGRSRQFHHIGVEAIGSYSPYLDSEVISLLDRLLAQIGLSGYQIKLNSIGCKIDRSNYSKILKSALKGKIKSLCKNCQSRFGLNIFRILDCKNDGCRKVVRKLPAILDYLCQDCRDHFQKVKGSLELLNLSYHIDPHLVRGLDYYTKTAFEVTHPSLGAKDAVAAGGRYGTLVRDMGGEETGACGFAIGVERVLAACELSGVKIPAVTAGPDVYIATVGEEAYKEGYRILSLLRTAGVSSQIDYQDKSLKAQMRLANRLKAKYVAILGEDEVRKSVVTLKDMASGQQGEVRIENLIGQIIKRIRG